MTLLEIARRMFERQMESYNAHPEAVDAAWEDTYLQDFWMMQAGQVIADYNYRKDAA